MLNASARRACVALTFTIDCIRDRELTPVAFYSSLLKMILRASGSERRDTIPMYRFDESTFSSIVSGSKGYDFHF